MNLVTKWENDRSQFEVLPRTEFNALCRAKRFTDGPKVQFATKEFTTQRWAIGLLDDGRYVCSDVAAE